MSEVEHIKETQADILEGVRGVKKNLYEPDSGLFSRVRELETESARRMEYILETKPVIQEHKELIIWKRHAVTIPANEGTVTPNLKKRDITWWSRI